MKRPRVTAGPFSFSDYSLGMRVIGLTGGIGCGKSLAAQYFAELGALVIDADQLARAAIERGSDGFDEVVTLFGDSILKDGNIDRRGLGELIFKDPAAKKQLESIIHPFVRREFEERRKPSLSASKIATSETSGRSKPSRSRLIPIKTS